MASSCDTGIHIIEPPRLLWFKTLSTANREQQRKETQARLLASLTGGGGGGARCTGTCRYRCVLLLLSSEDYDLLTYDRLFGLHSKAGLK
jgi:hypothetical protein